MSKLKPTDFAVSLSDFLFSYLPDQKGLSENTIKSYTDAFALFLNFFESEIKIPREKLSVSDIDCNTLECFLDWLEKERKCSVSSRNQRRAAMNTFFKYLQHRNPGYIKLYQQIKTIPRKNYQQHSIVHLSTEAVTKLLSFPNLSTQNGRRDFAILSLMYESGARVSEITDLLISDLRFSRLETNIHLLGKGRKSRVVPLIGSISDFLKNYLKDEEKYRSCDKSQPLFCNKSKQKLTRSGIAYILSKYVELARCDTPELFPNRIYPHILRHSRAMHWLESGIDLFYIKDLLGHCEIATTEVYARLNTNMKRKALEVVNPLVPSPQTLSWSQDKNLIEWLKSFNN